MDIPDYIKPQIDEIEAKLTETQELLKDPEMQAMAKQEIEKLNQQKKLILDAITQSEDTSGDDISTYKQAILEIRSAAGGEEAKIWADDLLRMYLRYFETKKIKSDFIDESSLKIKGKGCFALLQFESGVHRVQRIPETEKSGRIHTSTATVAVLPVVPKTKVELKTEDIRMDYFRSGGAGGQNVNKVNTGVRLTHNPTGEVVECTQKRTQYENREVAEELLRGRLWQKQEEERIAKIDEKRSSAVGRGMRAEKIRTYNYPQNRVTDHRINKSWYSLDKIMDGELNEVITTLSQSELS